MSSASADHPITTNPILRYFTWSHLEPPMQDVSHQIAMLAGAMDQLLPNGAEKSAGLRKLLEAKDCFVRSSLDLPKES